jgi:hypothetical protein
MVRDKGGYTLPGAELRVGHRRGPDEGANQLLKRQINDVFVIPTDLSDEKKSSSLQFIAKILCTPVFWFVTLCSI